jgi:hypothetical protein
VGGAASLRKPDSAIFLVLTVNAWIWSGFIHSPLGMLVLKVATYMVVQVKSGLQLSGFMLVHFPSPCWLIGTSAPSGIIFVQILSVFGRLVLRRHREMKQTVTHRGSR